MACISNCGLVGDGDYDNPSVARIWVSNGPCLTVRFVKPGEGIRRYEGLVSRSADVHKACAFGVPPVVHGEGEGEIDIDALVLRDIRRESFKTVQFWNQVVRLCNLEAMATRTRTVGSW